MAQRRPRLQRLLLDVLLGARSLGLVGRRRDRFGLDRPRLQRAAAGAGLDDSEQGAFARRPLEFGEIETLGLGIALATGLAMAATALLCVVLEFVLWRPLRARGAGFMSLFLASIGLALVLRQVIFLVAGPQSRAFDVDPYKVYVLGSVRLSGGQGAALVAAALAVVAVAVVLRVTSLGRQMRAVSDDRALAAVAGVDTGRRVAGQPALDGRGVDVVVLGHVEDVALLVVVLLLERGQGAGSASLERVEKNLRS